MIALTDTLLLSKLLRLVPHAQRLVLSESCQIQRGTAVNERDEPDGEFIDMTYGGKVIFLAHLRDQKLIYCERLPDPPAKTLHFILDRTSHAHNHHQ